MPARHVFAALILLHLALANIALAAAGGAVRAGVPVTLSAVIGSDGYAVLHDLLPYSSCRVVGVEKPSFMLPAKPVMLAFTPDPLLWRRLAETPIALPASENHEVIVRRLNGGVEVYAAFSGPPGARVSISLECFGRGGGSSSREWMAIIVPDNPLVESYARRIAELHEEQGLHVRIVRLSEIERLPAAQPPKDVCKPGRGDAPKYNLTLALKIIEFLREQLGKGLHYVLIIGGARDVPPIYVCSPILRELVGPEEAVVPTDYYYADPNYDGYVELAVGRIPTTNPFHLDSYVKALKKWLEGGDWQHSILVGGGAPFATTLLVGETAAEEAYNNLLGLNATPNIIALTLGNYIGKSFAPLLGGYGLYYLVTHGTGSAMLDYVPGGLWNYDFELKLTAEQAYTANPTVFMTPACRLGYWDYDLTIPPFTPPSIGVKLVESGSAVVFIGYSRIAVETITGIEASNGAVSIRLGGADAPLLMFLKQLGSAPTLGEAWRRALNAYMITPDSHYIAFLVRGEEEIGHLVVREAVFLGDPAAVNPWRGSSGGSGGGLTLHAPEGSIWVGASLIAPPLAKYSSGYIPAFNPGLNTTISLTANSCPSDVSVYALYRVEGYVFIGYTKLNVTTIAAEAGGCTIRVSLPYDAPSLLRILLLSNNGTTVYYMIAGGAALDKSVLVLRGLDALETAGDEVLAVTSSGKTISLIPGGSTSFNLTIPRSVEGQLEVRPLRRYSLILGGGKVAEEMEKLRTLYKVDIPVMGGGERSPERIVFSNATTAPSSPGKGCPENSSAPAARPPDGDAITTVMLAAIAALAVTLTVAYSVHRRGARPA